MLLHHNLAGFQPIGQLAGLSGMGEYSWIEDSKIFASSERSSNKSCDWRNETIFLKTLCCISSV